MSPIPDRESSASPVDVQLHYSSISSSSEISKTGKCEDTFVVGEFHLTSCPICLERFTLDNPAIVVICGHGFHLQCLEDWRQRSPVCPVCSRVLHGEGVLMTNAQETRRRRRRRRCKGGSVSVLQQHHVNKVIDETLPLTASERKGFTVHSRGPFRAPIPTVVERTTGDARVSFFRRVLQCLTGWCSSD
ncbi:hypothetical protein TRVL_02397 [Trypanosoma vivax]|nr:hypothetical protein TRVL_02397 [Trypanosoma vivax]